MRPQLVPFFPRYVLYASTFKARAARNLKFVMSAGMHCAGDLRRQYRMA